MDRILGWYRVASSTGAVVALVVANAIPLFGVLFLGWNVWMILIVYWLENGVVGFFNVLKILRAEGAIVPSSGWTMNGRPMSAVGRGAIAGFFLIHYGIFWVVHGVFVLTLPMFAGVLSEFSQPTLFIKSEGQFLDGVYAGPVLDPGTNLASGVQFGPIVLAVFALALSHGLSFWFNYLGRGEYRRTSPAAQMFAPYGRLFVLHITIILGGIAIAITGAPAAAVAVLVVLKTAMDIGFHLAEHRKAALPPETVATA
ncbi:MAG: hypothetical protein QOD78_623 [Chloroflexota bacterium]|nr:hypothetical protein [Chloroflexota bacterium]